MIPVNIGILRSGVAVNVVAPAWFKIAAENASITLPGVSDLRFGSARNWVTKLGVSGTFVGNVAFFGSDPNPGIIKQIETTNVAYKTQNLKIMPLGDSITGTYVQALWEKLLPNYPTLDFIGNLPRTFNASYDTDANWIGGYVTQLVLNAAGTGTAFGSTGGAFYGDARDLDLFFDGCYPDIVLMHFGTNHFSEDTNVELAAYSLMLGALRSRNPNVKMLVAKIIPQTGNPAWSAALNAAIPAWVTANTTLASPIMVVDQYTGFNSVTMTGDGTHPNSTGVTQMVNRWSDAIDIATGSGVPNGLTGGGVQLTGGGIPLVFL